MTRVDLLRRVFVLSDDGEKRLRLSAAFAWGEILDIGSSAKPNPYLEGTVVAFDLIPPVVDLPGPYTRFVRGDVSDLDHFFEAGSFDTVICLETIEHIPDHCRLMSSIARIVRLGGTVVLSTPHPYYWTTVAANVFLPKGLSASGYGGGKPELHNVTHGPYYGHIHLHAPRVLNLIAEERGLSVRRIMASTGWNLPFLAANLMYVYTRVR